MCLLVASLALVLARGALFSPQNKLFGTAIKNGPIPPHTELEVFNHSCSSAPCALTQVHVPSIYPGGGCPWDWENGLLRIYVDGDVNASIQMTLLQMASVAAAADIGNAHADVSPFSAGLFGKSAQTGGVWTTMRVPFQSTVRVTLEAPPSCGNLQTFWIIIRGVEALVLSLGEIQLPPTARLYQSTITRQAFAPLAYIPLASAAAGMSGMLLSTFIDATSADLNFLEGCFHVVNGDGTVQYLSSGAEDYFLSASYFDEGTFANSEAGLTYRGGGGNLSAYKTHVRDILPFHGGFSFVWRNNDQTPQGCPNAWPPSAPAQPQPQREHDGAAVEAEEALPDAPGAGAAQKIAVVPQLGGRLPTGRTAPLTLTSIVYYYAWPTQRQTDGTLASYV